MKYANRVLFLLFLLSALPNYSMQHPDDSNFLETIGVIDSIDSDEHLIEIIESVSSTPSQTNSRTFVRIPKEQFTHFLQHVIQLQRDYFALKATMTLPITQAQHAPALHPDK